MRGKSSAVARAEREYRRSGAGTEPAARVGLEVPIRADPPEAYEDARTEEAAPAGPSAAEGGDDLAPMPLSALVGPVTPPSADHEGTATVLRPTPCVRQAETTRQPAIPPRWGRLAKGVLGASALLGACLGSIAGGVLVATATSAARADRPVATADIRDVLLPVTYDFSSLRLDMLAAQYDVGVTSPFGPRLHPVLQEQAHHSGVDIDLDRGEVVSAGAAGVVVVSGWRGDYGRMVEIDHGDGVTTRYAHCDRLLVDVGDEVVVGDPLGTVGATGRATGPHLHFEVRVDGRPVDPQLEAWRGFFPIPGDEWSEEGVARRLRAGERPAM